MHWGHAVSDDLVHWEHRGIALYPSKAYDRNGVFSGTAVEVDGALYLYYTAVRYDEENPDNVHRALDNRFAASQALVISPDGETFDNLDAKRQVLPVMAGGAAGDPQNTRDPKVWRAADGSFRMVLGSTWEGIGQLLFLPKPGRPDLDRRRAVRRRSPGHHSGMPRPLLPGGAVGAAGLPHGHHGGRAGLPRPVHLDAGDL